VYSVEWLVVNRRGYGGIIPEFARRNWGILDKPQSEWPGSYLIYEPSTFV
jgi:hypothetical protein